MMFYVSMATDLFGHILSYVNSRFYLNSIKLRHLIRSDVGFNLGWFVHQVTLHIISQAILRAGSIKISSGINGLLADVLSLYLM